MDYKIDFSLLCFSCATLMPTHATPHDVCVTHADDFATVTLSSAAPGIKRTSEFFCISYYLEHCKNRDVLTLLVSAKHEIETYSVEREAACVIMPAQYGTSGAISYEKIAISAEVLSLRHTSDNYGILSRAIQLGTVGALVAELNALQLRLSSLHRFLEAFPRDSDGNPPIEILDHIIKKYADSETFPAFIDLDLYYLTNAMPGCTKNYAQCREQASSIKGVLESAKETRDYRPTLDFICGISEMYEKADDNPLDNNRIQNLIQAAAEVHLLEGESVTRAKVGDQRVDFRFLAHDDNYCIVTRAVFLEIADISKVQQGQKGLKVPGITQPVADLDCALSNYTECANTITSAIINHPEKTLNELRISEAKLFVPRSDARVPYICLSKERQQMLACLNHQYNCIHNPGRPLAIREESQPASFLDSCAIQ